MLLEVKGLKTYFYHRGQTIKAVDGVGFSIDKKKVLALVGESGCGKSVTALSVTKLIPERQGKIVEGEVIFEGSNLLTVSDEELRNIRGGKISYIFQEPSTSLNPVFTIGDQIEEAILLHKGLGKKDAAVLAEKLLADVGIQEPSKRLGYYPHQLSGGMKQRAMIAMALASDPKLLIADEPTTALDVTIQAQILELLKDIKEKRDLSIILITHDLSIVDKIADEVAVMYLGRIVERAPLRELLDDPLHPYTKGLLDCIPKKGESKKKLASIPGNVPDPVLAPQGCKFNTRCGLASQECRGQEPQLRQVKPGHWVRCVKVK